MYKQAQKNLGKRNPAVFEFKDFSMIQFHSGQRVNTDSCVFADLASQNVEPKRILDIGTGSGVVALMIACKFPGVSITAVEQEPDVAVVAKQNFEQSPWSKSLSLHVMKAQDLGPTLMEPFDLVLVNPPYFAEQTLSPDRLRAVARHTVSLGPRDTFEIFLRTLSPDGEAWLSCPTSDLGAWQAEAHRVGLFCFSHFLVHDHPESSSHISVLGWQTKPAKVMQTSSIHYRTHKLGPQSPWMQGFRARWYPEKYNANLYI
jgi:tRNA1Val (adenine37-N6)-methyltransferase